MRTWVVVLVAGIAALLLVAAAAVLLLQDTDEDEEVERDEDEELPPEEEEEEPVEPTPGSIEVTSAWIDAGDCITGEEDDNRTCHRLQVLAAAGEDAGLPVSIPLWEATDDAGATHAASWVTSPEAVPPGSTRTMSVSFDLDGEARLVELRLDHPDGTVLTASVPAYDDEPATEDDTGPDAGDAPGGEDGGGTGGGDAGPAPGPGPGPVY